MPHDKKYEILPISSKMVMKTPIFVQRTLTEYCEKTPDDIRTENQVSERETNKLQRLEDTPTHGHSWTACRRIFQLIEQVTRGINFRINHQRDEQTMTEVQKLRLYGLLCFHFIGLWEDREPGVQTMSKLLFKCLLNYRQALV